MKRWAALAAVATLLAVAGCHSAPKETESAARALLNSFDHDSKDLGVLAKPGQDFSHWHPKLQGAEPNASGKDLPDLQSALTQQLAIDGALNAGAARAKQFDTAARQIDRVLPRRTIDEDREFVKVSRELYRSVGCNLVWKAMTKPEQTNVNNAVNDKTVEYIIKSFLEAADEPIKDAGLKLLAADLLPVGLAKAVDWVTYAHDLENKAQEIVNTDANGEQMPLAEPLNSSGGLNTRAVSMAMRKSPLVARRKSPLVAK